jgi:hypothetical protein
LPLPERCKSSLNRTKTFPISSESRRGPLNPPFSPHAGRRSRERCGESKRRAFSFSRRIAPEACRPKPRIHSPQRNEGRRSAGRRDCPVGPRHAADVAIHLRFGRRPRVLRDALASRRSTAALTEVSRPRLFDFRPGFLGRGSSRALPTLSCPSPAAAPRAPAVIPVDMMPEAARERTVSVRARAPRPLCAIRSTLMMASLRPAGGGLISKYASRRQASSRGGNASYV